MKNEIKFTRKNNLFIIDQPDGSKLKMGEDQFLAWSVMILKHTKSIFVEVKTKAVKKAAKKDRIDAEIHAEINAEVNCYYY